MVRRCLRGYLNCTSIMPTGASLSDHQSTKFHSGQRPYTDIRRSCETTSNACEFILYFTYDNKFMHIYYFHVAVHLIDTYSIVYAPAILPNKYSHSDIWRLKLELKFGAEYTQKNIFEILLNQPEIRLHLPFSD